MFESPYIKSYDDNERTIGVEIEFSGLNIDEIGNAITHVIGGETKKKTKYEAEIINSSLSNYGNFNIELDASLFKSGKLRDYLNLIGLEDKSSIDNVEDFLSVVAMEMVPMEVVSPPIPISKLPVMDEIKEALRKKSAEGTKDSIINAFGMHLNPSLPSLEAEDIRDFLRAFVLMYDWLVEKLEIDTSRKFTPYIDPFPKDYIRHILADGYEPDISTLIDDYLEFNPTRNRPLDMLPLFTFMDEDRVVSVVDDGLTSSRPTFHYRLPNCEISNPDWSITKEWNYWAMVEKVAHDKNKLNALRKEYLDWDENPTSKFLSVVGEKFKRFWDEA